MTANGTARTAAFERAEYPQWLAEIPRLEAHRLDQRPPPVEGLEFAFPSPEPRDAGAPLDSWGQMARWVAAFHVLVLKYTQQARFRLELAVVDPPSGLGHLADLDLEISPEHTVRQVCARAAATLTHLVAAGPSGPPRAREAGVVSLTFLLDGRGEDAAPAQAPDLLRDGWVERPELQIVLGFDRQARVSGQAFYDGRLFRRETIRRLLDHLGGLAGSMASRPDEPVASLALVSQAEAHHLIESWRGPARARAVRPLHRYVEDHAARAPDSVAVSFRDRQLDYGALNRRANRLARYLLAHGLERGGRVAVCIDPCADVAVCLLAIFKAGGVYVPLEPSYPTERLALILEDTAPQALLTRAASARNLPPTAVPMFWLDTEAERLDLCADVDLTGPELEVDLAQTAFIIYTSGTTGRPKGVMLSHGNLVHYVLSARDRYGFGPGDVFPAFARFTFSITLFETLLPLVAGGRVVVLERDHVLDFKRLVPTLEGVTAMHASPSLLRRLLAFVRENGVAPEIFRRLRHVSSGGDLVSADLMESLKPIFREAELFVIYGCSEVSCMGCSYAVPRDATVTRSFVGRAFENTAVRLYDARMNLVPIGVAGEIYFSGAGVGEGYLDRADLTRERFLDIDGERFYRTGDLGRFHADGNLEILGRTDFQIKLRGIRIELGEIESTLRRAPGVREAVVAAQPLGRSAATSGHAGDGARAATSAEDLALVAYVVPGPGQPPRGRDLRKFLQAQLPDYMVPAAFVFLDRLPVNLNAKVDRRALPLPTPADLARSRTVSPPRTPLERRLVAIWEAVLGVQPIGVDDGFFEVGGNSLLALELMVRIERELGKTLPLSTLLSAPSVAELAAGLDAATEAGGRGKVHPQLVVLRPAIAGGGGGVGRPGVNGRPPIFFIHDGDGEVLPYRNLALRLQPQHAVYGIRPYSRGDFPMLHTRLGDAASHYTDLICQVQPRGPYFLGGLCIGGFLAFEVALRLRARGEVVGLVALIDAAHVKAVPRSVAATRLGRASASVRGGAANEVDGRATPPARTLGRILPVAKVLGRKTRNLIAYELRTRSKTTRNAVKIAALRYHLDRGLPLPRALEKIPVSVVLRSAEREYVAPRPYPGEVVLFRATRKDRAFDGTLVDDTPYVELFREPLLGWQGRADRLVVHDNPGGHSSMLQEPNVRELAERIQSYIDAAAPSGSEAREPGREAREPVTERRSS